MYLKVTIQNKVITVKTLQECQNLLKEHNFDSVEKIVLDLSSEYLPDKNIYMHGQNESKLLAYAYAVEENERLYDLFNTLSDTSELTCAEWLPNTEEVINMWFNNPYEALQATFYGNYRLSDGFVKLDGNGNLTSTHRLHYEDDFEEMSLAYWDENEPFDLDDDE